MSRLVAKLRLKPSRRGAPTNWKRPRMRTQNSGFHSWPLLVHGEPAAVNFYQSQGYRPTPTLNAEWVAREPEDIQMVKEL